MPEPITVSTRGDNDINSLTIYIFDSNSGSKLQETSISAANISGNKVTLPLTSAAKNNTVLIYAVANVPEIISVSTPSDLRKIVLQGSSLYEDSDSSCGETSLQKNKLGIPMIGFDNINTNDNNATIYLYRSVAKIYTTCTVANVSVPEFHVYQYNNKSYLSSAINTEDQYKNYVIYPYNETTDRSDYISTKQLDSFEVVTSSTSNGVTTTTTIPTAYAYPTKGFSGSDLINGDFIVVKVQKDNKDLYYRINLRKTDSDGELIYVDLKANYQYEIRITAILNEGYDSCEEAAKHPDCDQYLTYEIHDHAAEILSMITDGYNELGVTPDITLNSSGKPADPNMVVKCYNPDNNNIPYTDIQVFGTDGTPFSIDQSEGKYIFSKDGIIVELKGEHDHSDDFNKTWDLDTPGNQYEFYVYLSEDQKVYEDASWEFIVKWNGLKRTVKINYVAAFLLPEVCTVKLTIKDNDSNTEWDIIDYWTFVTAAGKNKTSKEGLSLGPDATPQLFGILPENMTPVNGVTKKRTNGFHFPMPYGKNNQWEYVYTVDFSPLLDLPDTGNSIGEITAKVNTTPENASVFNDNNVKWEKTSDNKGTLSFSLDSAVDDIKYLYAGGTITFTITYNDVDHKDLTSTIVASLYHTGFFHYEGTETSPGSKVGKYAPAAEFGYYYYEVVPMGDGYWLDRNIGAKSNKSFLAIDDYTEESGTEDEKEYRKSTGRYYSISGTPKTFPDDPEDTSYTPNPDIDLGMCPPGYHIPNSTEFDALRLSKDFITQNVVMNHTYYQSTYYNCGGKIGNVYLQKARYYNEDNIVSESEHPERYVNVPNNGDAGAGYYWTMTTAPGTEKEQMAAWLRGLYLNGSSSTYMNASISDHRMPIRCKAGLQENATPPNEYYISLNVHNATHVYLFNKDKSPLYTFPGKAVGSTSSSIKWQHFYCSTTVDPNSLLMLFVKLEEDGKVTIFKKDGNSFTADTEYDTKYLTEQYAWTVDYGKYYDFCETGQTRDPNVLSTKPDGCNENPEGDNSGNTGGDGETLSGEITLDLDMSMMGWKGDEACTKLAYGGYDWSSIDANQYKIKIDIQYYHTDFNMQLVCGDNWGVKLPNGEDIDFNKLTYKSTGWNTSGEGYIEFTLNDSILKNLQTLNGLVIFGNNFKLTNIKISKL